MCIRDRPYYLSSYQPFTFRPAPTTRVAGITTSSSYVPREVVQPRAGRPRDVVVSATRLDEHTDLQAIEHLDFEQAKACEHSNHEALHEDEPASYLAEDWCAHCDAAGQFLLCHSGLVSLLTNHTKCRSCGGRNRGTTRIVQVLR